MTALSDCPYLRPPVHVSHCEMPHSSLTLLRREVAWPAAFRKTNGKFEESYKFMYSLNMSTNVERRERESKRKRKRRRLINKLQRKRQRLTNSNEREASLIVFIVKITFHSCAKKPNFHIKSFAFSLAFVMRFKATRNWPIISITVICH